MGNIKRNEFGVPVNNKQFYSDNIIFREEHSRIITHFIEKNMQVGKDKPLFGKKVWLHRYGNIPAFWEMKELNTDVEYWIDIIDRMFEDDWIRENRCFTLRHIIEAAQRMPRYKQKKPEVVDAETIQYECLSRLGVISEPPKPQLNKYFREDHTPTWEAMKKFGVTYDFRFQIKLQTGKMPYWEEEQAEIKAEREKFEREQNNG